VKSNAASRQFIFDIFTQYQEGGPDYIYSLLTGYEDAPADFKLCRRIRTTTRISINGRRPWRWRSRFPTVRSPMTTVRRRRSSSMPRRVSAFLMWAAEPHLEDRKQTGFMVHHLPADLRRS
jgi:ubiquinol-cytochrome c reductase cytochrome c1 subunit